MILKCDFCSLELEESRLARFRAKSFESRAEEVALGIRLPVGQGSEGDWAACPHCAVLIFAQRWDELADKSVDSLIADVGAFMPRELLLAYIKELHREFRENRL